MGQRHFFKKFASAALMKRVFLNLTALCILVLSVGCSFRTATVFDPLPPTNSTRTTPTTSGIKSESWANKLGKDRWEMNVNLINLKLSDIGKLDLVASYPSHELKLSEGEKKGVPYVNVAWEVDREEGKRLYYRKSPPYTLELFLQDGSRSLIMVKQRTFQDEFKSEVLLFVPLLPLFL
jgi:hypothetical protein